MYCGYGDKSTTDNYSGPYLYSLPSVVESVMCCNCIKFCVDTAPVGVQDSSNISASASPEFKRPRSKRQVSHTDCSGMCNIASCNIASCNLVKSSD